MYSKKSYTQNDYFITPPPGYDGSRFGYRSDGRDDAFPPYDTPPQIYSQRQGKSKIKATPDYESRNAPIVPSECCEISEAEPDKNSFFPFLKKEIGRDELLIIALIIALIGEGRATPELIIILGLLLCI